MPLCNIVSNVPRRYPISWSTITSPLFSLPISVLSDLQLSSNDGVIQNGGQGYKMESGDFKMGVSLISRAVRYACVQFLPLIRGKYIKVMTDDTSCMFYINQEGGSKSPSLVLSI